MAIGLIGYWGSGDAVKLAQTLRRISQQPIEQVELSDRSWAIASLDGCVLKSNLVLLSACGRHNLLSESDIWIKFSQQSLQFGRDAFGRIPLYWLKHDSVIWFATQMQLLLPLVAPTVNLAALYGYSCFSYVPTPLTPIAQINAVCAGTEITVTDTVSLASLHEDVLAQIGEHQHWRSGNSISDETEAVAQLQTLLKSAIAAQIEDLPDEPVGVFLSGGIDSSIVAALLVQAGVKVRVYALDFGVEGYSELPYAQQVADYLKIPLIRVEATAKRLMSVVPQTAKALDSPYGDGVTAPLFLLTEAAAQEVRVIFNGEHGDQLFAGWTNKPLIANSVYDSESATESFVQTYLHTFGRLYGYESLVFSPDVYDSIRTLNLEPYLTDALDAQHCVSLLAQLRRASLMLKGAQNIQPRATAIAFAHNLWVRSPFCDRDLTRWTFGVSDSLMLQGACEKYILKRAVEAWLPPEIVWREKRGMGVPLKLWYYGELWSDIGHWLNPGVLRAEGRWQPQIAWQMMSGELGIGLRDRYLGNNLWLLIMWQAWRREVLHESIAGRSWDHPFWVSPKLWQSLRRIQHQLKRD